jgi:cyclopropane-fatty-acyl-phospholipid synthase
MTLQRTLSRAAFGLSGLPARALVFMACRAVKKGRLTLSLPDGTQETFEGAEPGPHAHVTVHHEHAFARLLFSGELALGETYMDGLWDADDLTSMLVLGIINRQNAHPLLQHINALTRLPNRRLHLDRRNSKSGSRRNVQHHYDLSNDLFTLFLDETMAYSSAVFSAEDQTLADAQRNKFDLLCRKAGIRPGDRVLEIGCGWGGFALHAALNYGAHVTAATISAQQLTVAQARVAESGLSEQVELKLLDYRDIEGRFDHIVSIEMFEAVGAEYFETFFKKCDSLLTPGGRLVMQTISVPERLYSGLREGVNWMQKYIFPGGMLPSLAQMELAIRPTALLISDVEDIAAHYVRTLQEWRRTFFANIDAVHALGFDNRFVRMWQYYLCSAEAGFATRSTGDLQIVFEKA